MLHPSPSTNALFPAVRGQGKILVVANDERTCYQLREVRGQGSGVILEIAATTVLQCSSNGVLLIKYLASS